MINRFVRGDLIFIPSDVTLLQFAGAERELVPNRWTKTKKPSHALFAKENEFGQYYKILYEGQYWFVERENIYEERTK